MRGLPPLWMRQRATYLCIWPLQSMMDRLLHNLSWMNLHTSALKYHCWLGRRFDGLFWASSPKELASSLRIIICASTRANTNQECPIRCTPKYRSTCEGCWRAPLGMLPAVASREGVNSIVSVLWYRNDSTQVR
jgi:hypothetical protein